MKLRYLLFLLFVTYACKNKEGNLSDVKIHNNNSYNHDIEFKKKIVRSYFLKDFVILDDTIHFLNRALLKKNYSRANCSWEQIINAIDISEKFVDIKNLNDFLKFELKLKELILFDNKEGQLLKNLILDTNFPKSSLPYCITNYDSKWNSLKEKYSKNLVDSISLEKVNANSNYSDKLMVSDYCSYNKNRDIILGLENNNKIKLYVCVHNNIVDRSDNYTVEISKYNTDDLLFEFEEYLDSEGFLQIKKTLLNPYSYNRIRSNRFE